MPDSPTPAPTPAATSFPRPARAASPALADPVPHRGVGDVAAADGALALLNGLGAAAIAHPGGNLVDHLQRVRSQLATWGARPALQIAGLCHSLYGTDGFPAVLLPHERRAELAAVIGAEAEEAVYLYGACDRDPTYRDLARTDAPFHDRLTGRPRPLTPVQRRDLTELTAANELDLARSDLAFREERSAGLLELFTRCRHLLSAGAWHDCVAVLSAPGHPAPK
ncbi:DUF6817 domain-containing protein [Streptomyces sp. NPDC048057]|uniref:DUF6817 domain-containing protein n=1 Tax=Streptomyces sp. NPDC048057 TaxID=3155628 RepID=UPI0033D7446D